MYHFTAATRRYPWGDTAISLHTIQLQPFLRGGGILDSKNSKGQDLPKFQWGGGVSWVFKAQSAKICLNFNSWGTGEMGKGLGGQV